MSHFNDIKNCFGEEALQNIKNATVMQLGIGAVGGFSVETLVRSGLGNVILCDFDVVDITNCNRQLVATTKTVGLPKTEVMRDRIKAINPGCNVHIYTQKIDGESFLQIYNKHKPDIVCDAIDSYQQKSQIIRCCVDHKIKLISSMGAARKTDPMLIDYVCLQDIHTCPLALKVRKTVQLKKDETTDNIICIISKEKPIPHPRDEQGVKMSLPSYAVITTTFGLLQANAVIHYLANEEMIITPNSS